MKADDGKLLDAKDSKRITPLLFAIARSNLKCVKSLIRHGADINYVRDHPECRFSICCNPEMQTPLITAIGLFRYHYRASSIWKDMFDFLLESGVDIRKPDCDQCTPLLHAANLNAFECIEKLVQNGARVDQPDQKDLPVFYGASLAPSLEAFKCLFHSVVDKNATGTNGCGILYYVAVAGNAAAVRYILSNGLTITNDILTQYDDPGHFQSLTHVDPLIGAIESNKMDVVMILEDNGCQIAKSLYALRSAVRMENMSLLQYLLLKYKYPLNQEYAIHGCSGNNNYITVLTEARSSAVVTILLNHGADPNKKSSKTQYVSPLHRAIKVQKMSTVACLIRSGADINCRSFESNLGNLLPFEVSIFCSSNIYAAKMLLFSGCSCGMFSLKIDQKISSRREFSKFANLLKKWNVQDNSVRSLYQMSRTVILRQLSPAANKKILLLPLPVSILKFLGIPELDDILENYETWEKLCSAYNQ